MTIKNRNITAEEANNLEKKIDAVFYSTLVPGSAVFSSRKLLCNFSEDVNRLYLLDATKNWHKMNSRAGRSSLSIRLDHYKYSLKHALNLIDRYNFPLNKMGKINTLNEDTYKLCIDLMNASFEYSRINRIFYQYYNEKKLKIDDSSEIFYTGESSIDLSHASLELLLGADQPFVGSINFLVDVFSGPKFLIEEGKLEAEWAPVLYEILKRVRYKKGKFRYQIITDFAQELYKIFEVTAPILNFYWNFPWGNLEETSRYFYALSTVCLYHIFSIHFAADRQNIRGGGLTQICLHIEIEVLNREISALSKLDISRVQIITAHMTYGNQTKTPDPALQPLIPIENGRVAAPGIFILSSNWPRNALSLHARISPSTFDPLSKVFEVLMIESMVPKIPKEFEHRENIFINTLPQKEEIDLIIVDRTAKFILICELRWMIQPGDAAEVYNRRHAIFKKVSQVDRKFERFVRSAETVFRQLKIDEDCRQWSFGATVVIDGYGGVQSPVSNKIPVVHKSVFLKILQISKNLDRAHAFLCSPLWLPKEGKDFQVVTVPEKLCGYIFSQPGFGAGKVSYLDDSLPEYFLACGSIDNHDLRRTRWPI